MKITLEKSLQMFRDAGIDRDAFIRAIIRMGKEHLKTSAMRKEYDINNPTKNYCYVVAEWLRYLVYDIKDKRVKAFKLEVEGYDTNHNFLTDADGNIIDLSAEQFENYDLVDYSKAKPTTFMMAPSKRAKLLNEYYLDELNKTLDTLVSDVAVNNKNPEVKRAAKNFQRERSFPVKLKQYGNVVVLRDDLIEGGTKSIYVDEIIQRNPADGYLFSTPPEGGYQIALASACRRLKKRCVIVTAHRKEKHKHTLEAKSFGAEIVEVETNAFQSRLEKVGREFCENNKGIFKIEFGANYDYGIKAIARRMRRITELIGREPEQIFCSVGSATLAKGILLGTDRAQIFAVMVGKNHTDAEFDSDRIELIRHRLKYQKPLQIENLPFPCNETYEAKAFETMMKMRDPNKLVLFWNVYK